MITDFKLAMVKLFNEKHGTFETVYGITVSGSLDSIQDPIDDPRGIGFFTLRNEQGRLVAIYWDEFKGMVEDERD